MNTICLAVKQT